jgi:hypothetical protein
MSGDWCGSWCGSVVRFEDDALMARNGAPFVKYDVTGLKELLCWSVDKAESAMLLGKTEEGAGHQASREFAPRMCWHVDVGHAAKNMESRDVWFSACVVTI